jgi:D-glycero-D-manno-heptose 1,7-bisphosphate phosphatase
MKTVIMAGGKGTRIASLHQEIPKPMIPICDKPVLEYALESLQKQGYTEIIMVIGHLGEVIRSYFGDGSGCSPVTGQPFGVTISYIVEENPLGTAGALYILKEQLQQEDEFLLVNGDIIFDIDLDRFLKFHRERKGIATLFSHPNAHPFDSAIIVSHEDGQVTEWLHPEQRELTNEMAIPIDQHEGETRESISPWYHNQVNAGLHIISGEIFYEMAELFRQLRKLDLDRDILKPLIPSGRLYAYNSPEYVKDMGTPERLAAVAEDIKRDIPQKRNLHNWQKAIFLDRDGTINRYVGFLRNAEDMELLPGAAEAIRQINQSDYLAIVVTNQPVIARGEVTWEGLREIHNKMETILGMEGAYLDGIYVCPHHPDKGFDGEIPELKIECDCRKPKPGLLLQAAESFHIDLKQSWMIGDEDRDVKAGVAVNCRESIKIKDELLLACVDAILKRDNKKYEKSFTRF